MRPAEDDDQPKVSIYDFIIPQKVDAFLMKYKPVDKQMQTSEVFNDARLREFFKAIPTPYGDPLKIYVEMLIDKGFQLRVSIQGEPAIFVQEIF